CLGCQTLPILTLRSVIKLILFPYTTLFRSRWTTCFEARIAIGEHSRIWAAQRRAAGRASPAGTTSLTKPSPWPSAAETRKARGRSEEHTSELQSRGHLVCRLLLEKTKT